MRFLNDIGKSTGCLDPFRQSRGSKVKLLLLFITVMANQTHAVANLEQSCCSYQNGTIFHYKLLQTSKEWVPRHTEESNWRAFMSRLPSTEEANWRDAMSQAIVGTVMDIKFLGEDGSMGETFFNEGKHRFYTPLNESEHGGMELILPPEVENTTADSSFRAQSRQEKLKDVEPCKESMQDGLPPRHGREPCLVTVPSHYVRQNKWPLSQLKARVQNVPHSPMLQSSRSRAWVHVNASTIVFLPGGPMYPMGAESYLNHLMQLVPELGIGTTTRVALDLECGTGSLSRVLGMRNVTTLCLSAYDSLENGVQLVMERGFPGLLSHSLDSGSSRQRLPYPSQAFDLLHCAVCNISWTSNDGTLLFEADRILRNGGFFVWFMDVSNQGVAGSEFRRVVADMMNQAEKLCWKLVIQNHQIAVWQKLVYMTPAICRNHTHVPLCSPAPESKSKWKVGMKPCLESTDIFPVDANWTSRLMLPSKRLKAIAAGGLQRAKQEVVVSDFNYWVYMTDFYIRSLGSSRVADIRNVLDLNAGFGSFAAALAVRTPPIPWWVLNVVPVDEPDRLPILFDRGLLGIYHDWCEPLDSYARTFDLVHASRFFAIQHRCSSQMILLEIDRLLRPGGFVLFRDHKEVLLPLQEFAKVLHWKAHIDDTESGKWGIDKLLHCQKSRWIKGSKPKH